jgi:SOS-response transcriptional repressor LexA
MSDEPRGELTPRQREIADWIRDYHLEHDMPPTFRELMSALGMRSPNGAEANVKALRKKGWLRPHHPAMSRGLVHIDIVTSVRPNRTTP